MADSNLNGRVLNTIIDFDLIVNTELGLIRFIRENYQDNRAFDLSVLNKSDREILSLLYSRTNINPLSVISTKENMCDIDNLYKSFMETYKSEIIEKSVAEGKMLDFVSMMISTGPNIGLSCAICVRDNIEQDAILSHLEPSRFITKADKMSILNKDVLYIRDFKFFTDSNTSDLISHKKIYTSPTTYNENYISSSKDKAASTNQFVFIGKDYRKLKGESKK